MITIREDNTRCLKNKKFYAVTDLGHIYGATAEIVQAKIDKKGAKEKTYMSDAECRKRYLEAKGLKEEDLPKDELLF